jgi:hypothetical protein
VVIKFCGYKERTAFSAATAALEKQVTQKGKYGGVFQHEVNKPVVLKAQLDCPLEPKQFFVNLVFKQSDNGQCIYCF